MNHECDASISDLSDEEEISWSMNTPLHRASINFEKLKSLLANDEFKCMINQRNRFGFTPIRIATMARQKECCYLLTEFGANPDLSDIKGQTCLHIATQNNDYDLVSHYLSMNCDPNGDCKNIVTPLYQAVLNENQDIIELLIKHRAPVDGGQNNHDIVSTPLGLAISKTNLSIVQYLLNAGANPTLEVTYNSMIKPRNLLILNANHTNSPNKNENAKSTYSKYIDKMSYTYILINKLSEDSIKLNFPTTLDIASLKKKILFTLLAAGLKPFVTSLDPNLNATKKTIKKPSQAVGGYDAQTRSQHYASFWSNFNLANSMSALAIKIEGLLFAKPLTKVHYKLHQSGSQHDGIDEEILTSLTTMTCTPLPLTWLCRLEIRKMLFTTTSDRSFVLNENISYTLSIPPLLRDFISLKLLYL